VKSGRAGGWEIRVAGILYFPVVCEYDDVKEFSSILIQHDEELISRTVLSRINRTFFNIEIHRNSPKVFLQGSTFSDDVYFFAAGSGGISRDDERNETSTGTSATFPPQYVDVDG
jgi:hypothetical protein